MTDNHVMDWDNIRVLDREEDRTRKCIKEVIWIKKSMPVLNRDEGGYQLSHFYDSLITIPTSSDHSSDEDGGCHRNVEVRKQIIV